MKLKKENFVNYVIDSVTGNLLENIDLLGSTQSPLYANTMWFTHYKA